MKMKNLPSSSNLDACGYDPETCTLTIQFKSGGTYSYDNVPPEHHAGLCEAKSPGNYFYKNIRSVYLATKHKAEPATEEPQT